jgi:hypothetical protein
MNWRKVTMAYKLIVILVLTVITQFSFANPSVTKHGKVVTKQGVVNPHLGVIQSGSGLAPKVTVTSPHGKVRVDTKDGPIFIGQIAPDGGRSEDERGLPYPRCLLCHSDIENVTKNMAGMNLYCDFCHGGDPFGETIETAHVFSDGSVNYNETIPPLNRDLEYQKWLNPSNLRVVESTCGACHPDHVVRVKKSLMATAAGHYAGGFYQNNVVDSKTPVYGTFAIEDTDGDVPTDEGAVESLLALISYDPAGDQSKFATHYRAVPSQACARCHLWSRGRGYTGAGEFGNVDGTYRADGCAACHMMYSNTGFSESADMSINHFEGGHPKTHVISKQIPSEQCIHCHHRGARIGLNFTGRAQMPPRLPSGPDVPGTTDELFNKNYHYASDDTNPQDVHAQAGLHCIDCHTNNGIHGDGNIYGHMDQATKIECRTCHGLPNEDPTLIDNDGISLTNVELRQNGDYVLTSKVDGVEHIIPTAKSVVQTNPMASCAMNDKHLKAEGGLECYSCHTSWLPNCFGCHFERDETQMGLNYITGEFEVGKVSTNNKIFEALRQFSFGPNSEGRVAPYVVACHPIADVTAPDGSKKLDFVMPVTSNGLSGLAHNPVQPHTVRGAGEVRTCAECHRSPASLGFGTGLYTIARDKVFTVGEELRRYNRYANPNLPEPDGSIVTAGTPTAIATKPDVVEGTVEYLYVAQGVDGVSIFNRESETPDDVVGTVQGVDAIDIARVARYLYVVDRGFGIRIYDNEVPDTATLVSSIEIPQATRVVPWGIYLFVPALNDGLVIINIANHETPYVAATVEGIKARDVFIFSHYQIGNDFAIRAYVADSSAGVHVIDLLPDIEYPQIVETINTGDAFAVDVYTRWVVATDDEPSREHDYLYVGVASAGLDIYDITNPDGIYFVANVNLGGMVVDVEVVSQLAPPGVDDYAVIANETYGLQMVDVTDPLNPVGLGTVPDANGVSRVFVEVQQMDRFLSEQGDTLKENSHPFTGTIDRDAIVRILSASIDCDTADPCPSDVDGDGIVGVEDILAIIASWGPCPSPCASDVDGDGNVGVNDLLEVVGSWGVCP